MQTTKEKSWRLCVVRYDCNSAIIIIIIMFSCFYYFITLFYTNAPHLPFSTLATLTSNKTNIQQAHTHTHTHIYISCKKRTHCMQEACSQTGKQAGRPALVNKKRSQSSKTTFKRLYTYGEKLTHACKYTFLKKKIAR